MVRRLVALVASLALLAAPSVALAKDGGGGEVRVNGTCGRGASSELRVRARDGSIRVEFRVTTRTRGRWNVVLVHERRVDWRGRMSNSDSSYRIRRSVSDFNGPDEITLRASGPRGTTCTATATLGG